MSINLIARLGRLEADPRLHAPVYPRLVRIVVDEGQEEQAYKDAEEMGIDTSPESRDILIIRILARKPDNRPHAPRDPAMQAIAQEHVAALMRAVDGRTRSI